MSDEEEDTKYYVFITIHYYIQFFPCRNSFLSHLSHCPLIGAIYNVGCAQIKSKFGKEVTSEAKKVPDRPCIDSNWACIGSRERNWACKFSHDSRTGSSVCQDEKETGYHMWEK